jgi:hypothetical protein
MAAGHARKNFSGSVTCIHRESLVGILILQHRVFLAKYMTRSSRQAQTGVSQTVPFYIQKIFQRIKKRPTDKALHHLINFK